MGSIRRKASGHLSRRVASRQGGPVQRARRSCHVTSRLVSSRHPSTIGRRQVPSRQGGPVESRLVPSSPVWSRHVKAGPPPSQPRRNHRFTNARSHRPHRWRTADLQSRGLRSRRTIDWRSRAQTPTQKSGWFTKVTHRKEASRPQTNSPRSWSRRQKTWQDPCQQRRRTGRFAPGCMPGQGKALPGIKAAERLTPTTPTKGSGTMKATHAHRGVQIQPSLIVTFTARPRPTS